MRTVLLMWAALLGPSCSGAPVPPAGVPAGWHLLFSQEPPDADNWWFSDGSAWRAAVVGGRAVLELHGASAYRPRVRSPRNLALLEGVRFSDFALEVDCEQTGRDGRHRDLCFFFGFRAPDRFFYAHLATAADDHAHNLFAVDRAARVAVGRPASDGIDWGRGAWRRVLLVRRGEWIRVYFDGAAEPELTARDGRFSWGHVGLGSFDDTGRFARIRIWGPGARPGRVEEPR